MPQPLYRRENSVTDTVECKQHGLQPQSERSGIGVLDVAVDVGP
jgi:hypothetical protein